MNGTTSEEVEVEYQLSVCWWTETLTLNIDAGLKMSIANQNLKKEKKKEQTEKNWVKIEYGLVFFWNGKNFIKEYGLLIC